MNFKHLIPLTAVLLAPLAAAPAGGAEKRSLMLGVGMGDATWFDDVSVMSISVPK